MADVVQEIEALEADNGETVYKVGAYPTCKGVEHGDQKVKEIGQHAPQGPGDVWFYQVIFGDDSGIRVYNMTKVHFGAPKKTISMQKPKIIV